MPQGSPIIAVANGSTRFHFLVREGNGYISREERTVAGTAGIVKGGTIMSTPDAGVTYRPWVTGDLNACILAEDVDTTGGIATKRTFFMRHVEVQRSELFFAGAPTDPQKQTAYGQLAANAIILR